MPWTVGSPAGDVYGGVLRSPVRRDLPVVLARKAMCVACSLRYVAETVKRRFHRLAI
jgi:hypothetical protein